MSDEIKQQFTIDASQALQELGKLDTAFSKFQTTVQGLASTLQQFNGNSSSAANAAKNLGTSISSNLGGANQAVERLSLSFGLLSRVVTTQAIVRALSGLRSTFEDATKSAIEFETKLSEIQTIDPGSTLGGLAREVRGLSDAFNIDLLDVAKAKYEALSSGFTSAAQQSDVLNASFKFSKVALTDAGKSLELISGTLNAFGKDSSEAEALAAKFFKTVQLGAIRGPELATALGRVSPTAAELGVSIDELLAQFAALTIGGTKPAEAATQLNAAMTALIKPSDAAKEALRTLGFSSAEALIQAKGLQGGLQALIGTTDGSAAAIGRLFPNVRALKDALAVNQRGDVFADFKQQISSISTGEFNNILGKRLATDSELVTSELNKMKNALTEVGGQFVSTAASASRLAGELPKIFNVDASGADVLIAAIKPFEPVLLTAAAAITVYSAAALKGATANAAFVDSFKGISAGLLLGAGAAAGGNFLGNQLTAAIDAPQKAFDKAADAAIDAFRKSAAERVAAEQEADSKLLQGALNTVAELNKVWLQDVKNAQDAGKQLVDNAEKTANAVVKAREKFGQALDSSLSQSRSQGQASQTRVANLQQDQSDVGFNQQLDRLNDAQQVFALINRSSQTANAAAAALTKAAQSGNQQEINQAIQLFGRAQQESKQAEQIAGRTNNRALEARAVQNLTGNLQRQIDAEQKLQRIEADREAKIQQLQEKQQGALDVLREQQAIITKNSNPLDAQGNLLSPDELAKRQKAIQDALAKINGQKLGGSDLALADSLGLGQAARDFNLKLSQSVTKINFDTTAGIEQVKGQLNQAFQNFKLKVNIDVDALSKAVGRALNNPTEVAGAINEVQTKLGQAKQGVNDAAANDANAAKLKTDLAGISAALDSTGRQLLRFAGPSLLFKSQTDQVTNLKTQLDQLSKDPNLTDEKIANFFRDIAKFKNEALQGNVAKNVGLAFDVDQLAKAAELLKQLQQNQQAPKADTSQLQTFDQILKDIQAANPAGQFGSAATSINSSVGASQAIADAWKSAAESAKATAQAAASSGGAQNKALGGFVERFATGGFAPSGTDSIPAMLSPRESVINQRQSERFHPQIVAMNAGITPSFPSGNVTNNTGIGGDVTVNVNSGDASGINTKQIATELNRLIRRGAAALKI